MELTDKQKRQVLAAAQIVEKGDMAVLEKLIEHEDTMEEKCAEIDEKMSEVDSQMSEMKQEVEETKNDLVTKVDGKIAELKDGVDGKDGKDGKDGRDGRDGKDGRDGIDGKDGANGVDGKDGKDGSPDTGEEIIQKINSLSGDAPKIGIEHIEGLSKRLDSIKPTINAGIVGRDIIKDIDISEQLDGVTTTFNIPAVWNIFAVNLSSYPYGALRKGIDYTFTPTSITFTSEIDAATQLSTGQKCILQVVTG